MPCWVWGTPIIESSRRVFGAVYGPSVKPIVCGGLCDRYQWMNDAQELTSLAESIKERE